MFVVASLLTGVISLDAGAGSADVEFGATQQRFLDTEDVKLSLVNNEEEAVELFGGSIRAVKSGKRITRLAPRRQFLKPGAEHTWTWTTDGRVGRFEARFRTSAGKFTDRFERGAYFTLGFDQNDTSFILWVREKKPIRQLRADLNKAQGDRRIVSGIVSEGAGYNPAWSYTMGPGTIVLGEVFIEVCDASPRYVENHRRQWTGDRWCPWSSYVKSEGRP